ncbi:hypothetical protein [Achromobacter anxifer]
MPNKLGARRLAAATAGAIHLRGRAMLAAAPWSLAVYTLTLPFALRIANLFPHGSWLLLALALSNLIALARMSFAWHRVVNLQDPAGVAAAEGGTAEARHLLLLGALVIAVTVLARITGDLPFVIYMVMGGSDGNLFWGALFAALALLWVPALYAFAECGLSLPRAAVTGEFGFRAARAAMPYKRWPLMFAPLVLIAVAGYAGSTQCMLTDGCTVAESAQSAVGALLCVPITFVVATMYAVAYRDSQEPAPRAHGSRH